MQHFPVLEKIEGFGNTAWLWIQDNVFVSRNLIQLLVIALAFAIAYYLAPRIVNWLKARRHKAAILKLTYAVSDLALPLLWAGFQWFALLVASSAGWPYHVLKISASLVSAWVIIRLLSELVRNPVLARGIAWTIWTVAALNILNLLEPTRAQLQGLHVPFLKETNVLEMLEAIFGLAILLWAALYVSNLIGQMITTARGISPSQQVLISKLLKFALVTIAFLIVINIAGIDLTALTVIGGAVGLGIGFGLQRIVANLISGVVLLMDKSIKPGDVIAVEDTYGWVNTLGGRYVSVITRDGVEHLIPNDTLINERVENWTHSHTRTRLRVPIGVHYETDVPKAIDLCIEAADEVERVLERPAPTCLLMGFGDSAVNLELRFWIRDPARGISNVKSAVLLKIWEKFSEQGIRIPYPQRDLHIKTPEALLAAVENQKLVG